MKDYKLRDNKGYLVNRCNICGRKLDNKNRGFMDDQPICLVCLENVRAKMPPRNKAVIRLKQVKEHRKELYDKAINNLIDGQGDAAYTRLRWKKLKRIL